MKNGRAYWQQEVEQRSSDQMPVKKIGVFFAAFHFTRKSYPILRGGGHKIELENQIELQS